MRSRSKRAAATEKRSGTTSARARTFKKRDWDSGDGMLTSVWGPGMWHFLHTMSFNYPVAPSQQQQHQYRTFIIGLQHILPCKYCRMNLRNNFKTFPLQACHMKNRDTFSRYVYRLHEIVNKMLGKQSGLTYCDVRERYEHFRSRCTADDNEAHQDTNKNQGPYPLKRENNNNNNNNNNSTTQHDTNKDNYKLFNFGIFRNKGNEKRRGNGKGKENGCTEPLHGAKSKCIIKIVPQDEDQPTFTVDDKCIKTKIE